MTERADQVLTKTPVGATFLANERIWIFIGWRRNTAGHEMVFVRSVQGADRGPPHLYHASMADTLCRKFTSLDRYRKKTDDQG